MNKLTFLIVISLLVSLNGCSGSVGNNSEFEIVGNSVIVSEHDTGEYSIMLAFEVSNSTSSQLFFKASDFDIVDEEGNLIDTMHAVNAYPAIINHNETAVYYDAKISEKISDANVRLTAIPHIETEKSVVEQVNLSFRGITGWRGENAIGIVANYSAQTEYNDVHVAIIARTESNDVVSVMTATIDSIKPKERVEIEAEDCAELRVVNPVTTAITHQNFVYLYP